MKGFQKTTRTSVCSESCKTHSPQNNIYDFNFVAGFCNSLAVAAAKKLLFLSRFFFKFYTFIFLSARTKKSETAERKQRCKKRPTAHFSYGTVFLRIVNFEVSRMREKKLPSRGSDFPSWRQLVDLGRRI